MGVNRLRSQIYYLKSEIKSNRLHHSDFITRKGNSNMADTSLKTRSIVSPTILNGRRISQIRGSRMMSISARGQHNTNRIHQRIIPIRVFIVMTD
jgi:hypothetical protein